MIETITMRSSNFRIQSIFYGNPDYYPPIINGAYILHDEGYAQQILCREYRQRTEVEYPESLEITRILPTTKNSLLEYLNFLHRAWLWRCSDADVFIGHDMHGFLAARLLGWRYRRPVIYHCHDFVEDGRSAGLGGSLVKAFENGFARTADLVIVPDRERAEVMVKQLHLNQFPEIVANAPLQTPDKSDNMLKKVLQKRGCQFEQVVLRQGSVGRGHCLEVTIRSIPHWNSHHWGFIIMGPGDDAYKQSLSDLANKLGVSDQVVFLPAVKYTEVLKYTVGADLGHALYEPININHQYSTTAANKIMEYMAAGIPTLLSDTASSRAFLDQYPIGLIANINFSESIASTINQIFGQPERSITMGNNGRQAFINEFRYDKQYAGFLDFLSKLNR